MRNDLADETVKKWDAVLTGKASKVLHLSSTETCSITVSVTKQHKNMSRNKPIWQNTRNICVKEHARVVCRNTCCLIVTSWRNASANQVTMQRSRPRGHKKKQNNTLVHNTSYFMSICTAFQCYLSFKLLPVVALNPRSFRSRSLSNTRRPSPSHDGRDGFRDSPTLYTSSYRNRLRSTRRFRDF